MPTPLKANFISVQRHNDTSFTVWHFLQSLLKSRPRTLYTFSTYNKLQIFPSLTLSHLYNSSKIGFERFAKDQIFDHDCSCFCLLVDVLSDVLYSSVLHFLVTDLAYFFRLFVYFSLFSNSPLDLNFLVFGKKIIKDRVESLEDGFDLFGLKVVEEF